MTATQRAWLAFLALVAFLALDMASDVLLRGGHHPGASPWSWDIVCNFGALVAVVALTNAWRSKR